MLVSIIGCYYAGRKSFIQINFIINISLKIILCIVFNIRFGILVSMFFSTSLAAAPSGADLLTACENATKNGFDNTKGMLCIWYVTPCDCHFGKANHIPRVCLPDDVSHQSLAKTVIKEIKARPELKQENAEETAATILAPLYPCKDGD